MGVSLLPQRATSFFPSRPGLSLRGRGGEWDCPGDSSRARLSRAVSVSVPSLPDCSVTGGKAVFSEACPLKRPESLRRPWKAAGRQSVFSLLSPVGGGGAAGGLGAVLPRAGQARVGPEQAGRQGKAGDALCLGEAEGAEGPGVMSSEFFQETRHLDFLWDLYVLKMWVNTQLRNALWGCCGLD